VKELPRPAAVYVLAVSTFGGALLLRAALHLTVDPPAPAFVVFVCVAMAAEAWQLQLSYKTFYSVGLAISLASAVVFGVEEAILVSAVGMAAGDVLNYAPRRVENSRRTICRPSPFTPWRTWRSIRRW
jgi:hypothetical protein